MIALTGAPVFVHANALVIDDKGLLIRGPSRAGKSALTLDLLARAPLHGRSAHLVGDDRVSLELRHGMIIARPHPRIAGMIEKRGDRILNMPYQAECALALVIDLSPSGGAPDHDARFCWPIADKRLPHLAESYFSAGCAERIIETFQLLTTN